jgi:hypothetical protein
MAQDTGKLCKMNGEECHKKIIALRPREMSVSERRGNKPQNMKEDIRRLDNKKIGKGTSLKVEY